MRRQQQGRPELGRSSPAGVSCWGLQSARAPPGLPAPSSEAPAKTHIRRRSFGAKWFGRHDDNAAADPSAQPSAQPQAPNSHGLEAALFDLNLDDERSPSAGGFAGKGSSGGSRKCASPAHAAGTPPPLHRRRWSFGRQVMPQPVQTDAAEAAAEVDGRGGDDLLVTASSSVTSSSARSSPQHPAAALAQQQQQQQQQAAPATPPQARGPSYRRLWNSITSVRKGDPLPAHASGPSSDVTVESLVKAVQVGAGEGGGGGRQAGARAAAAGTVAGHGGSGMAVRACAAHAPSLQCQLACSAGLPERWLAPRPPPPLPTARPYSA